MKILECENCHITWNAQRARPNKKGEFKCLSCRRVDYDRIYLLIHPNERKTTLTKYYKEKGAEYCRVRRSTDIQYRLAVYSRARLGAAIKGRFKAGSAVKDLGCSIEDFKLHLEALWLPGMDWASWEPKGWHIDHIQPLSSFDLTDREQFLKACHYTNLQPLWALAQEATSLKEQNNAVIQPNIQRSTRNLRRETTACHE